MSHDVQFLIDSVGSALAPHGFRDRWRPALSALDCVALWRLCTWNVNRAVALLIPTHDDFSIGPYCQRMKWRLLWRMGFVPLFYEVGLQMIVVDHADDARDRSAESASTHVDLFSNQLVTLQSVFVVAWRSKQFTGTRTWGQVITGKYQDAIAEGIRAAGFVPS